MSEILDFTLIQFGEYSLNVASLIGLIILFTLFAVVVKVIKGTINRTDRIDEPKKYSIFKLVKYVLLVVTILIGFQILGFNLSLLLAGSAALLVGLGLGLQNLFNDYISGLILLISSSIKVGDVIEVDQIVCQVSEINLRTTTVLTRDDKYIILPNSTLTSNHVINWTLTDLASRFEVSVGVDYSSDVQLVIKLMKEAAVGKPGVLDSPEPFVRFDDFADSSLNFSVHFWSEDVFRVENIKSRIRQEICELFRQNKVQIPFPQRVIHTAEK